MVYSTLALSIPLASCFSSAQSGRFSCLQFGSFPRPRSELCAERLQPGARSPWQWTVAAGRNLAAWLCLAAAPLRVFVALVFVVPRPRPPPPFLWFCETANPRRLPCFTRRGKAAGRMRWSSSGGHWGGKRMHRSGWDIPACPTWSSTASLVP